MTHSRMIETDLTAQTLTGRILVVLVFLLRKKGRNKLIAKDEKEI